MNKFARHPIAKWSLLLATMFAAAAVLVRLEPDRLTRYKNHLAVSGEELSLVKLSPPHTREAVDFHTDFSAIADKIPTGPIFCGELDYMGKPTNGFSVPLWVKPMPNGPAKGSWDDLAAQMQRSETAFAELRQLLARPPSGSRYDPTNPLRALPGLNVLIAKRRTAQGLAGSVINELHQQHLSAALTNLHTLITLARIHDQGGMLVDYMIQVAIGGLAISASWESLQASGWTESQLIVLQAEMRQLDFASQLANVLERERAFGVSLYAISRTNTTELRRAFGSLSSNFSILDRLYDDLHHSLWVKAWAKSDELRYLEAMQPLVEETRRGARGSAGAGVSVRARRSVSVIDGMYVDRSR